MRGGNRRPTGSVPLLWMLNQETRLAKGSTDISDIN